MRVFRIYIFDRVNGQEDVSRSKIILKDSLNKKSKEYKEIILLVTQPTKAIHW